MSEKKRIKTGIIYASVLTLFVIGFLSLTDSLDAQTAFMSVLVGVLTYFIWYAFFPHFNRDEPKVEILK